MDISEQLCFGVGEQILVLKFFYSFADDIFISIRQVFVMYHKDVVVVVNRHDDCGVPPGVPERVSARNFILCRGTRASRKGLLDGARDPPGFNAGMVDLAYSS